MEEKEMTPDEEVRQGIIKLWHEYHNKMMESTRTEDYWTKQVQFLKSKMEAGEDLVTQSKENASRYQTAMDLLVKQFGLTEEELR